MPLRPARILPVLLLALAAACQQERASPPPASSASPASPAEPPDTALVVAPLAPCAPGVAALCFHATRAVDLAGDGRPFRLSVAAMGPRPDSLRVTLRLTRDDTTWYRADWRSAFYGQYDDPRHPPSADSVRRRVEARLARLLADSAFTTVAALQRGAADPDAMLREVLAFDVHEDALRRRRGLGPADSLPTEALAEMQRGPAVPDSARVRALADELRGRRAFRFFRGGEYTSGIAWSARERRFVTVYSCC